MGRHVQTSGDDALEGNSEEVGDALPLSDPTTEVSSGSSAETASAAKARPADASFRGSPSVDALSEDSVTNDEPAVSSISTDVPTGTSVSTDAPGAAVDSSTILSNAAASTEHTNSSSPGLRGSAEPVDSSSEKANSSSEKANSSSENIDKKKKPKPGGFLRSLREFVVIVVIACLVAGIINNFVAKQYVIPSESMEPTLTVGDRIIVDRLTYRFNDPEPGDVVVFKGPEGWNEGFDSGRSSNTVIRGLQNLGSLIGVVRPDENDLVKRIIAKGGQTIQCLEGDPGVMVDGKKTDDSFTKKVAEGRPQFERWYGSVECGGEYFGPVLVKPGFLWVMGDNRLNSLDSRFHGDSPDRGQVPVDHVRGKVRVIAWPISRWQKVPGKDLTAQ